MDDGYFDGYIEHLLTSKIDVFMYVYNTVRQLDDEIRVGIYGAGEHTRYLFELTEVHKKNILYIFDKSAHGDICGIQVTYPEKSKLSECDLIIISSRIVQNSIENDIIYKYEYNGKIVRLYTEYETTSFYEYYPQYCEANKSRVNRYNRVLLDRMDARLLIKAYEMKAVTETICEQKELLYLPNGLESKLDLLACFLGTEIIFGIDNAENSKENTIQLCLDNFFDAYYDWIHYNKNSIEIVKAVIEGFCYEMEKDFPVMVEYKIYNQKHEDYISVIDNSKEDYSDVAIVVQGPVLYNNDYTYESIMQYKSVYPGVNIVLSTWKAEECNDGFDAIRNIDKIEIVLSDKPDIPGPYNINMQTTSAWNGIWHAKMKLPGVGYVLKLRTDERMYSAEALRMLKYLSSNKKKMIKELKGKIICSATPAVTTISLYYADHWNFGHIDDMLRFWDKKGIVFDGKENSPFNYPESFLYARYWNEIKKDEMIADNDIYTLIPMESLEMEWNKYWYLPFFESRNRYYCWNGQEMPDQLYGIYDILVYNDWK